MNLSYSIGGRLRSIRSAVRLSSRIRDLPMLAIFGLARFKDFSHNDLISRLGRRLFPLLKVRTDRLDHVGIMMNPADGSHFTIFDEVVVENVYDLNLLPFVPELVVDCGGHIGLFTARAAGRYPAAKVVVFEPMPKNAAMIRQTVSRNKLNVELNQAAVSDRNFQTKFFERVSYGGSLTDDVMGVVNSYDVQVVDLIAEIQSRSPQNLLLKVDIEGEEENLLPKLLAQLPDQTAIFFETHTAEKGWELILNSLTTAGFATRLLRERDPYRDGFALRTF